MVICPTKKECEELRRLTGKSFHDSARLLADFGDEERVLDYLRQNASVPEFVGTGKMQYDIFKNGELYKTFSSVKEFDSFDPYPLWQIRGEYKVRVLTGDGNYHWISYH